MTIETSSAATNDIAERIGGASFAASVMAELGNAGEDVSIQEQKITGMEVLFSVKAATTGELEATVINNSNFASEFAAAASIEATVVVDTDRVSISTLAPTVDPTVSPTGSPTFLPTGSPSRTPSAMPTQVPTFAPTMTSCADGTRNNDESDVDCGGSCHGCGAGKACAASFDCWDTVCESNVCVTFAPTLAPSGTPSTAPTDSLSTHPSVAPTLIPTISPSGSPTTSPSYAPSAFSGAGTTFAPTVTPSVKNADDGDLLGQDTRAAAAARPSLIIVTVVGVVAGMHVLRGGFWL